MLTYRVASLQPRPVQTELLGTRTPVTYGNMTQARARDPNMHAAAGGMMRPKRYQLLLRPRNDICRPSIHSRVAARRSTPTPWLFSHEKVISRKKVGTLSFHPTSVSYQVLLLRVTHNVARKTQCLGI